MSKEQIFADNWQACPEGKIGAFAARLKRQERRPVARLAAPLILCMLSGALVVQLTYASQMERERVNRIGGISCADVVRQADAYIVGKITGSLRSDMGFHLSNCPNCAKQVRGIANRDFFSQLFSSQDESPVPVRKQGSQRKKWCDDDDPSAARQPVVAQKVVIATISR